MGYNWRNEFIDFFWDSGVAPPVNQWSLLALSVMPTNATIYIFNTNGLTVALNDGSWWTNYVAPRLSLAFDATEYIGTDPGDTGGAMFFHRWDVDDLSKRIGHDADQIRSRILFAKKVDFDKRVWIVAENGAARAFSAYDFDAPGDARREVHDLKLILKAVVDIDMFGRHAKGHEIVDNGGNQLWIRIDFRRARAIDLDAHDVAWRYEVRPGIAIVRGAGQLAHAAREHRLNGLCIDGVRFFVHRTFGADAHGLAWVAARKTGGAQSGEPRYGAICGKAGWSRN